MFPSVANSLFGALKQAIHAYEGPPRIRSHIVELLSISAARGQGMDEDAIVDQVVRQVDPLFYARGNAQRAPQNATWADYQVSLEDARVMTVAELRDGRSHGWLDELIPHQRAEELFDTFAGLFESDRRYYSRLGLGDPDYIFSNGVVITDRQLAGVLWVLQTD